MFRRVVLAGFQPQDEALVGPARLNARLPGRYEGTSKPLDPLGTAELAEADCQRQLRPARRRAGQPGLAPPPPQLPRFVDGTDRLTTARRFNSRCCGQDHPAFAALRPRSRISSGGPHAPEPDHIIELVLDTGKLLTRPLKLLSEVELAELCTSSHTFWTAGCWSRYPTAGSAGHTASVVFARKPRARRDWSTCYDFRGLNAVKEPMFKQYLTSTRSSTRPSAHHDAGSPSLISPKATTSATP
jgi:hypothetical protein